MKFLYVDERGGRNQSDPFIKAGIEHHIHLLRPRPFSDSGEIVQRKRRWHAPDDEVIEHFRRQIWEGSEWPA